MKKLWILGLALGLSGIASGQVSGNANYNNNNSYQNNRQNQTYLQPVFIGENIMEFEVRALMNVQANSYTAIFNVTQSGETAAKAEEMSSRRINAFKEAALKAGVAEKDIYIDMVSLVPVFEYDKEKRLLSRTYNEVPKGFELQKNIHIVYKNSALIDQLLAIAAASEIYDLAKVEYQVDNTETIYNTLREKSIEHLQQQTASYKKLGVQIDTAPPIVSEASAVVFPPERYVSYQAYSSEDQNFKGNVNSYRKQNTYFYNKLPYNQFQIVINPVVLEPVVQYTYVLRARYTLKNPAVKQQYLLITPDGTLKTLDMKPVQN